jgi:exopolyphosphatase / guanosine-5'-triphosphate,3'-diphosphate pyrophosphatase
MNSSANQITAAIDIGSSSIRMDIAEIQPDGFIHVLDSLIKGVQLGRDVLTEGHLSQETIQTACDALGDFKKVMDTYGVMRYRAVATNAVRDSSNGDTFLDRLLMSTGLDVEIIDRPEENRFTISAAMESLSGELHLGKTKNILVEVGEGRMDVALLNGRKLQQSGTFPLGSIHFRAGVGAGPAKHDQQARLLRRRIDSFLSNLKREIEISDAVHCIAVGDDVRFAARILNGPCQNKRLSVIPMEKFSDFVDSLSRLTIDELVHKYSVPYPNAETLAPQLLTYLQLLRETQAQDLIVSDANIRSGILRDLAPANRGKRRKELAIQTLSSARSLGRRYHYDENHAERVRELSLRLFDELKTEQRMTDTHRLYLEIAALLHDIGSFVSLRSHHKHTYYLISSSELFGLRRPELEIIANIARYHRRALPQHSHPSFISLEREERMIVSKLAAILRVANALNKDQLQTVMNLKIKREGDQIAVTGQNVSDLVVGKLAFAERSNFFTEIFGIKITLREVASTDEIRSLRSRISAVDQVSVQSRSTCTLASRPSIQHKRLPTVAPSPTNYLPQIAVSNCDLNHVQFGTDAQIVPSYIYDWVEKEKNHID